MSVFKQAFDRLRKMATEVEDELYEWADQEDDDEEQVRGTLFTSLQGFLTLWKATEATVYERVLGLLGFGGLLWLVIGDLGFGIRHRLVRWVAAAFAAVWFIPGLIAAVATLVYSLGLVHAKNWRTYPVFLAFAAGGLIAFRAVFGEIGREQARLLPRGRRTRTK
jgi:AcrR family transcriptional regulator